MKEKFFEKENKEDIKVTTETISGKDLRDFIYKGNFEPQEKRFLSVEEGGVFKYFKPTDAKLTTESQFYSLVKEEDKIVGLSQLLRSGFAEGGKTFWIQFLSIDPEYQGKGYSKKLIREIFKFAKTKGFSLENSGYSSDGKLKLKNSFQEIAKEFNVSFLEDH
jgi:GNAT superfamily N-acetyltransferase